MHEKIIICNRAPVPNFLIFTQKCSEMQFEFQYILQTNILASKCSKQLDPGKPGEQLKVQLKQLLSNVQHRYEKTIPQKTLMYFLIRKLQVWKVDETHVLLIYNTLLNIDKVLAYFTTHSMHARIPFSGIIGTLNFKAM